MLEGKTNELETTKEPDTTRQTGRQMTCCKWKTNDLETAREPDTTTWTEPATYLRKN